VEMIYFGDHGPNDPGYAHGGGIETGTVQWCYI